MVKLGFNVKVTQNLLRGQVQRAIKHDLDELVEDVAEEVLEDWQRKAPVDEGDYRDSLHIEKPREGTRVVASEVPGPDPYDIYQEYGTEEMAAHPSARPSAELHRDELKVRGAKAIEDAATRAAR